VRLAPGARYALIVSVQRLVENRTFRATSISTPIAGRLEEGPFTGQVLSVHRRACNLVDERGQLLALVSDPLGNGPFHMVISRGAVAFSRLAAGWAVRGERGALRIGDSLAITYRGGRLWDPCPDWGKVRLGQQSWRAHLAALQELLGDKAPPESLAALFAGPAAAEDSRLSVAWRAQAGGAVSRVLAALRVGDLAALRSGATALAGLGPGLTPAGDDFLLGVMVGLFATALPAPSSSPSLSVAEVCAAIAELAAARTTALSAAWLQAAARGLVGQGWHDLLDAVSRGDSLRIRRAANRLINTGATSGADALTGFLLYCQSRRSVLYSL
jgi:hypothetical protein